MKKELYLIISHEIDTESASNALIGVYCTLDVAIAQMRDVIYHKFEDIKEWWEETDEGEDSSEEEFQEWIEDNYLNDEHTLWSYTDDDPVEHAYKIQSVEVEYDCSDLYALICTRVDGVENRTDVLGVYGSQNVADEELVMFEAESDDDYYEVVTSVIKIAL